MDNPTVTPEIEGPEPDPSDEFSEWSGDNTHDQCTYVYRIDETVAAPDGRETKGVAYVAKIVGPIDPEIVRQSCGGGHFELKIKRGRSLRATLRVLIAGPRTAANTPGDAEPATPSPSAPFDPEALARSIVAGVSAAIAQTVPARVQEPDRLDTMLVMVDKVLERVGRTNAPDPMALVQLQFDTFQKGLALGKRESGGERGFAEVLAEHVPAMIDLAGRVLDTRRTAVPPVRTAPTTSSAQPDRGNASSTPTPPEQPNHEAEQIAVAGMVARAIRNDVSPADLATMLDLQLTDAEIDPLLASGPVLVSGVLRRYASAFPELAGEGLEDAVRSTLAELARIRRESAGEVTPAE